MASVTLVLHVAAIVCLALAAVNVPSGAQISLGWLGLFFWFLPLVVAV